MNSTDSSRNITYLVRIVFLQLISFYLISSEQHPSMNSDLPNRILCGRVIIKPNIKQFTSDGHGVVFEDETRAEQIDAVILSTGYIITFPYLSEDILSVKENRVKRNANMRSKEKSTIFP